MTTPQRSYNMSRIRGKDTKPEMIVRKYLWAHGFRYRLNHPRLPGKPDVVLRKYRTCVFVNGCFWHGHNVQIENGELKIENWAGALRGADIDSLQSSECCKIPKTNREFWVKKILRNKARDIEVQHKLTEMGWHSITIWECELSTKTKTKTKTIREQTLESLIYTLNHIYLQDLLRQAQEPKLHKVTPYTLPEEDGIGMAAEGHGEGHGRVMGTGTLTLKEGHGDRYTDPQN